MIDPLLGAGSESRQLRTAPELRRTQKNVARIKAEMEKRDARLKRIYDAADEQLKLGRAAKDSQTPYDRIVKDPEHPAVIKLRNSLKSELFGTGP